MAGPPKGSRNASVLKPWEDAIKRCVLANDGKKLRAIAEKLTDLAMEGEIAAIKEVGERLDGKSRQPLVGDDNSDPIKLVTRIERVIIDNAANPDS